MNENKFREMRRKDRQMSDEQAIEILKTQKWGVLSVSGDEGYPYGVPVNYGYVDGKIYIHSTSKESHKIDAIRSNAKVCLTVVEKEDLIIEKLTTHYRSVIVFGTARIIDDAEEKVAAIWKMMKGINPEHKGNVMEHCGSVPSDFTMIEIMPEHITGKGNLWKKVYLDVTELKECTSVWMKDVEIVFAGTTVYSMSARHKNEEYQRYADEYDIHFIFDDNIPKIDFYTIPQVDILAIDSKGGYIGTIGQISDLESDAPICYIDSSWKCYLIAQNGKEFLEKASTWNKSLEKYEGVIIYNSKEDAMKENEFINIDEFKVEENYMQHLITTTSGKMVIHSVRLHRGDDILKSIKELAQEKNIKAGVVLSAVGCVLKARLRDASGVTIRDIDEHCEIVSLNGTVSEKHCHLHLALSKEDLSTVGGHMTEGCIINTTCELVIAELPGQQIDVEFDQETGYDELIFRAE